MKYLRKFEELSPEVYRSAARELNKIGRQLHGTGYHKVKADDNIFKKRSNDLSEWANYSNWKNRLIDLEKSNTKVSVTMKCEKETFKSDFYMLYFFDKDIFNDNMHYTVSDNYINITFCVSFIPADEESYKNCKENFDDPTRLDMIWLSIKLNIDNHSIKFDSIILDNDNINEYGSVNIDRLIIGKIRNTLIKSFSPNGQISTNYGDIGDMYRLIENVVMIEAGLSSDYGLTMYYIKEELEKISANQMLLIALTKSNY